MKDNPDGGKMVIISSQRGISAMENIAPYSITKAAVMGMVRSLAVDFAKFGIQVNGIDVYKRQLLARASRRRSGCRIRAFSPCRS